MNRKLLLAGAIVLNSLTLNAQDPIDYVDMMIGTTGAHVTEYGGTTPSVSQPFGMTQWCATTRINEISKAVYHHKDTTLHGFMATHQPAVWMGDYAYFTMMPQVGELKIDTKERAVKLDHSKEQSRPYLYSITYGESGKEITTEFTATSRCSYFSIDYPQGEKAILMLEAGRQKEGGGIEFFPEKGEVRIFNKERHDSHLGPQLYNFKGYYVLKFSKPFKAYGTWEDDTINPNDKEQEGSHVGGYIEFADGTDIVEVRAASSFISYDQALENMRQEIPSSATFTSTKEMVKEDWAQRLNRVTVKGGSKDDLTVFYTAFFRTMQYPREFSEYGRYYSPFDDKVHQGVSYNAFSLWDTFRAQHPWLLVTNPERVDDMITAMLNMYDESGWLPKWPNPSFTNIMIGTHADAVIADAYVNGFRGYDVQKAYQAIRKDAFEPPYNDKGFRWGDRHFWSGSYEARGGLDHYINGGYVASDITDESVARTLEFGINDYSVAQMAKELGYNEDYKVLMQRAQNYKNLYNKETGFFQARLKDGSWDRSDVGFTEGANWTYRFCVMQDVDGMVELMGGQDAFISELDRNFNEGHYRHDNEPGHHYAYLYSSCGRLDKTQELIPQILDKHYTNKPDGLSGNDDCGQMSAWYLFSSLGFYPLTPASGEYVLGVPRFDEVTIHLPNKKEFTIKAKGLERGKPMPNIKLNGKTVESTTIPVRAVLSGGTLEFSQK